MEIWMLPSLGVPTLLTGAARIVQRLSGGPIAYQQLTEPQRQSLFPDPSTPHQQQAGGKPTRVPRRRKALA